MLVLSIEFNGADVRKKLLTIRPKELVTISRKELLTMAPKKLLTVEGKNSLPHQGKNSLPRPVIPGLDSRIQLRKPQGLSRF
jgi:hypothetical protein